MDPSISRQVPAPAQMNANSLLQDWRVQTALERGGDLPFPLHSPLPPGSPMSEPDVGFVSVTPADRSKLALLSMARMARKASAGGKTAGIPTAEFVHSMQEWFARNPGDWTEGSPPKQLEWMLEAVIALADVEAAAAFESAYNFEGSADRNRQREAKAAREARTAQGVALALVKDDPDQGAKALERHWKKRLNLLAAGIFGTPELAARQASEANLCSESEVYAARQLLQQPIQQRALLGRLFIKLLRAHLALPAPLSGPPHLLESRATELLGVVVVNGQEALQPVAEVLALALAPGAPFLNDNGLPRCFRRETLQTPTELTSQARWSLLGTDPPTINAELANVLDAVQTLARELARVVTDPMRANALGFDGDVFRAWTTKLEQARKPGQLPARLKAAGDDATATYLALDFMPRLKRWKDQHSAMAGQPAAKAADDSSGAKSAAENPANGMADALQRCLQAAPADVRAAVAMPMVEAKLGRMFNPRQAY